MAMVGDPPNYDAMLLDRVLVCDRCDLPFYNPDLPDQQVRCGCTHPVAQPLRMPDTAHTRALAERAMALP